MGSVFSDPNFGSRTSEDISNTRGSSQAQIKSRDIRDEVTSSSGNNKLNVFSGSGRESEQNYNPSTSLPPAVHENGYYDMYSPYMCPYPLHPIDYAGHQDFNSGDYNSQLDPYYSQSNSGCYSPNSSFYTTPNGQLSPTPFSQEADAHNKTSNPYYRNLFYNLCLDNSQLCFQPNPPSNYDFLPISTNGPENSTINCQQSSTINFPQKNTSGTSSVVTPRFVYSTNYQPHSTCNILTTDNDIIKSNNTSNVVTNRGQNASNRVNSNTKSAVGGSEGINKITKKNIGKIINSSQVPLNLAELSKQIDSLPCDASDFGRMNSNSAGLPESSKHPNPCFSSQLYPLDKTSIDNSNNLMKTINSSDDQREVKLNKSENTLQMDKNTFEKALRLNNKPLDDLDESDWLDINHVMDLTSRMILMSNSKAIASNLEPLKKFSEHVELSISKHKNKQDILLKSTTSLTNKNYNSLVIDVNTEKTDKYTLIDAFGGSEWGFRNLDGDQDPPKLNFSPLSDHYQSEGISLKGINACKNNIKVISDNDDAISVTLENSAYPDQPFHSDQQEIKSGNKDKTQEILELDANENIVTSDDQVQNLSDSTTKSSDSNCSLFLSSPFQSMPTLSSFSKPTEFTSLFNDIGNQNVTKDHLIDSPTNDSFSDSLQIPSNEFNQIVQKSKCTNNLTSQNCSPSIGYLYQGTGDKSTASQCIGNKLFDNADVKDALVDIDELSKNNFAEPPHFFTKDQTDNADTIADVLNSTHEFSNIDSFKTSNDNFTTELTDHAELVSHDFEIENKRVLESVILSDESLSQLCCTVQPMPRKRPKIQAQDLEQPQSSESPKSQFLAEHSSPEVIIPLVESITNGSILNNYPKIEMEYTNQEQTIDDELQTNQTLKSITFLQDTNGEPLDPEHLKQVIDNTIDPSTTNRPSENNENITDIHIKVNKRPSIELDDIFQVNISRKIKLRRTIIPTQTDCIAFRTRSAMKRSRDNQIKFKNEDDRIIQLDNMIQDNSLRDGVDNAGCRRSNRIKKRRELENYSIVTSQGTNNSMINKHIPPNNYPFKRTVRLLRLDLKQFRRRSSSSPSNSDSVHHTDNSLPRLQNKISNSKILNKALKSRYKSKQDNGKECLVKGKCIKNNLATEFFLNKASSLNKNKKRLSKKRARPTLDDYIILDYKFTNKCNRGPSLGSTRFSLRLKNLLNKSIVH